MKATKRFTEAIIKLYSAYYQEKLIPNYGDYCAVGTICDNTAKWVHFTDLHGSKQLNYVGKVHQNIGTNYNGYSPQELLNIEAVFLKACGYQLPLKSRIPKNINTDLFYALEKVIDYLAEMDGVSNFMKLSKTITGFEDIEKKGYLKGVLTS